jgi:hypothetical protein
VTELSVLRPLSAGLRAALSAAVVAVVSWSCGGSDEASQPEAAPTDSIAFREFSVAPSLARSGGSRDPASPEYGALSFFVQKARAYTTALEPTRGVALIGSSGTAPLADVAANAQSAVYIAGGTLNGTWGFVYNSIPFGPSFEQMTSFLFDGGGVELVNRIYEERGLDLVAFPVVGSPPQMSGYFERPVGTPECPASDSQCGADREGIGLDGLCTEPWTLRYLPPAETIVDRACDDRAQRLSFVQAVPGGSELLRAVQLGDITGLEFATVLDDIDASRGGLFTNASAPAGSDGRNAGEVGLRFAHYPGWHQPFYLGWVVFNRSQVWESLDPEQRSAIERAAREAVQESFAASGSVQCEYLARILGMNDGRTQRTAAGEPIPEASADVILTRWRSEDLARLRTSTLGFLESLGGGASPTADQMDYSRIMTALLDHLGYPSIQAMLDAWDEAPLLWPERCAA